METQSDQDITTLDVPIFHSFSMEKIYHFVCGECKNWWSYANNWLGKEQFCPHCGVKKKLVKFDDGENPRWERDVT